MNIRRLFGKRLTIVIVASLSLFLILTIFSNQLPVMSVVESGSMQHSDSWTPGVINTGDIILEKKVPNPVGSVITYVQGRSTNFSTYGDFGNVIFYNAPGNYSIVHRAMFYLEWNGSTPVILGYHEQSWINITRDRIIISDVGYSHRNLIIYTNGFVGKSGFITMGDSNLAHSVLNDSSVGAFVAADQNIFGFSPITPSNVQGIAYGHIPWAGLIKLNIMRAQGQWQYYDDVPQNSYLYLVLTIFSLSAGIFFSTYLVEMKVTRKNRGMS